MTDHSVNEGIPLADGSTTFDPRLDRLVKFDERSRAFPVTALLEADERTPRSYTWRCDYWLDQGTEGACTGFSTAHEIAARPVVNVVNDTLARELYIRARQIDEWPGEDYDGSSVLAAVKAASERGYFGEYRWAFGIYDLAVGLRKGPAILGINWYTGMFDTDDAGFLHAEGQVAGGHAILCHGLKLVRTKDGKIDEERSFFKLHNSWGRNWGVNGEAFISWADLDRLLDEQGEACIPIAREYA